MYILSLPFEINVLSEIMRLQLAKKAAWFKMQLA